jgi:hypothetical protein
MDSESGSRALGAADDLLELLRLAQAATERLEREVHGPSYEMTEMVARDLQRLRRLAERLKRDTETLVSREQSEALARGHPLRRATDRAGRRPLSRPN